LISNYANAAKASNEKILCGKEVKIKFFTGHTGHELINVNV